jgi:hypothetical protein
MDRADLVPAFGRKLTRFEQQQVGIAYRGSQGIVYSWPHLEHVSAENSVALRFGRHSLSTLRPI